jgi:hypothetical protein
LYNLWIKANERNNKRWKQRRECIQEIVNKIPPTECVISRGNKGIKYVTHYKSKYLVDDDVDDRLHKTHTQYNNEHKCYTTSDHGYVGETNDVVEQRNETIDLVVDGDLKLELGTKLKDAEDLTRSWFSGIIFKYLWQIIEGKLRHKGINKSVFTISICGTDYYVTTDNTYNNYHIKYKLGDPVISGNEMDF